MQSSPEDVDSIKEKNFTLVLKEDGTVWGWGKNEHGELGVGVTSTTEPLPLQTASGALDHVKSIEYDGISVVATREDGSIWKSSDQHPCVTFSGAGEQRAKEDLLRRKASLEAAKEHLLSSSSWKSAGFSTSGDGSNNPPSSGSVFHSPLMMVSGKEKVADVPQEPYSLSLAASGPYREPANIELIAYTTHPEKLTKINFYWNNQPTPLATVTEAPYEVDVTTAFQKWIHRPFFTFNPLGILPTGALTSGEHQFKAVATYMGGEQAVATITINILPPNQYSRGLSPWNAVSMIEALDFQTGVFLDDRPNYLKESYPSKEIDANNNFARLYPQGYPWFLRTAADPNIAREPCYHLYIDESNNASYSTPVNQLPMIRGEVIGDAPPMVAFGAAGGGKELFVGQSYRFGINAGGQRPNLINNSDFKIEVYDKESFTQGANNVVPILTKTYTLPRTADQKGWSAFNNEGFLKDFHLLETYHGKTIDFDTQVQYVPEFGIWGNSLDYPFVVTHRAGNSSFYYRVSVMGATSVSNNSDLLDMAKNKAGTAPAYNLSYTLDFNEPAPWSATFLNQPYFQTIPLPSRYQGKNVDELFHKTKPVRDTLYPPEKIPYDLKALDNSPELKSHPELDRIVADYGNDPMALANYVLNEIELSDAIGYNVTGEVDDTSINPQGVSRDALGTYLEGQGSPAEQCGLLIYLLRKAGYPAAYVFPQHNQTLLFDEQLSKLLQMQIRGVKDSSGNPAWEVPELIPVNYPWVAAYIDGKWIHIFPWLKDTSIIEGKDVWNYFPSGYQNGTQWLIHYLLNDPELRSLSTKDNLGTLFTIYTKNRLAAARLTLDDVGMHIFNHHNHYTSWDEFPRPWQTPLISQENLAQNLDVNQNGPALTPALKNIFDTIEITLFSDRGNKSQLHPGSNIIRDPAPGDPTISTGPLRMVDLHNRRFLLRHQPMSDGKFKMILSLEAFDSTPSSTDTETYSFNAGDHPDPGNLRSHQEASTLLQTTNDDNNDNHLCYNITHLRHRQAQALIDKAQQAEEKFIAGDKSDSVIKDGTSIFYPNQFPGVGETIVVEDSRPLLKGDMAVLNLNYGRVTHRMQEFEAQKYWQYQQYVKANPKASIDPEIATGQLLQVMGQSYYYKLSQFHDFLEPLLKVHCVTTIAHGFTKLSPERNSDGTPTIIQVNGHPDLKLAYPNVDMSFQDVAFVNPCSMHPDSGDAELRYLDAMQLEIGDGSANEHRIINEFFGQDAAISTVRLLDIAQGWTPQTGVAAHPGSGILRLTKDNYLSEGEIPHDGTAFGSTAKIKLSDWATYAGIWGAIKETFSKTENPNVPLFSTVFMTPAPVTAVGQLGQPFTGMGAMVLGIGEYGAYISGNMVVTHGGSGGAVNYDIPQNDPPPMWVSGGSLNLTDDGAIYNNVAANVINNGEVNYYNDNGSYNNFDTANDQISNGSVQLDPQTQSSLNAYTQTDNSLTQEETENDGSAGIIFNNPRTGSVATTTTQQNIASTGEEVATALEDQQNRGDIGNTTSYSSIGSYLSNFVYDPVSVVTGEFYINALDLKLNGPMPLEIRRSYSSQNQANNNFGYGWKMNYFPYLMLSSDSDTSPSFIYAAEMDGSVIAYRRENLTQSGEVLWVPKAVDNPNLVNIADGSPGPNKNLFNNRITQKTIDGVIFYTLTGADGSIRTFKTLSFPIVGSDSLTRTRPYLQTWQDNQGNAYNFTFGNDNKTPDWGELIAISSSNGNSLHFHYDTKGHIMEAFTNDGRILKYEYSAQGDLIKVILPDASVITYDYQKQPNPSGKGSYSTHLIIEEATPGGRVIRNSYDTQRRVISQAATIGTSPIPTTSATFKYEVTSVNDDKTINGKTEVTDVNGRTTTYVYVNSQITTITYPQNGSGITPLVIQEWNQESGYPRSLKKRIDRGGLITAFQYDSAGNLTSRSISGNLTGNGGNDTATTKFTYNSNNILTSVTDPIGNITSYSYDNAHPYSPTSITKSVAGNIVSSLQLQYINIGGACGLLSSLIQDGSTTSYGYDAHGFLATQTVQTGTEDPQVTTNYKSNRRGEIVSETDSIGRTKKYSYDAMGRRTGIEIYNANNQIVDWHYTYYNGNGDITWEQGSDFNPTDYTYYDYDRAGHLVHKASWLTAALDASGVIDAGLSEIAYTYDGQGNITSVVDPNGHTMSMSYDALGEMTSRTLGDGVTKESFIYDASGHMTSHTTVLSGQETYSYTSTGQLQSTTHADGTISSYKYDLIGRLVEEVSTANGSILKINYDDSRRKVTRTFCNASGSVLGEESQTFDPRGNVIEKIDRANNKWTMSYDGLNRIKSEQGPSDAQAQQSKYYTYSRPDCVTITNEAGEWSNIFTDALGRRIQTTIFNADGSIAKSTSNQYHLDHHGVTTITGSGKNAITTTLYTDTFGHLLLLKNADGSYQLNTYDKSGNKTSFRDEEGKITNYTYDALNHLSSETLPDGTVIKYSYNAAGELEKREMPKGITEKNNYNTAGQKIASSLVDADGKATRLYQYHYADNATGKIDYIDDPRGFRSTLKYDNWGNLTNITSSGSSVAEQNQTTTYTYDPRGLLVSVAQNYNDPSTGPSTEVARAYNAYGQLTSETTSLSGKLISSWNQTWDKAGRRTALNWNLDQEGKGAQYQFAYNALGLPTSASNITGTFSYSYADQGLLSSKKTALTTSSFTRDNRGRFNNLAIQNKYGTVFSEHLDWNVNNQLHCYNVLNNTLSLPMESRTYEYDLRDRVSKEPYLLKGSLNQDAIANGTHANCYYFDDNNGLGILVGSKVEPTGTSLEGSSGDSIQYKNSFDQPTLDSAYSSDWYCYPWNINYDGQGDVTARFIADKGITYATENLTWDSFGRLIEVSRNNQLNGENFIWKTIYDGLGRRIETSVGDNKINYYYDPEVEFLELGHSINGNRTWNLYGPDRSGTYGGAEGIGGLESGYQEATGFVYNTINNYFGDIVGIVAPTYRNPARYPGVVGGYGPMPGSDVNHDLEPQWRGHYLDITGFYYMGARYYNPQTGKFLSPDPLGHDANMDLYSYCNGDPVNGLDPDGRCVEGVNNLVDNVSYSWNQADNQYDADTGIRILAGIPVSILSGDAFTHYTTPEEYSNQHGSMPSAFSANGIFAGDQTIINIRSATASGFGFERNRVFPIQNPSYGLLDFVRAGGQQAGAIDITALRAADMINASGGGTFVAHSNGAALFYAASPLLKPEVKANISYKGYGPQININQTNDPGLRSYYNDAGSNDWIARVLNPNAHWDRIIPQSPFHPFDNHGFEKTYATEVR